MIINTTSLGFEDEFRNIMLVSMFSLFLGSSRPSVSRHNAENRALKKSAATSSRRFFFFFHFFASCFLRCALTLTERLEEARPQSAGIFDKTMLLLRLVAT